MYHPILKLLGISALLISIITGGLINNPVKAQNDDETISHLVISIEGDTGSAEYNRIGWELYNKVLPGLSFLPTDLFQVSGSVRVIILCTDLTMVELYTNTVAACDDEPDDSAFANLGALDWTPASTDLFARSSTLLPNGTGDVEPLALDGDTDDFIADAESAIQDLDLDADTEAYALAMLYLSHGLYADAVVLLESSSDLQCTEAEPTVDVEAETGIFSTPQVYLRLGEAWAVLDNAEISARYLNCAIQSAGDIAFDRETEGIALMRLAALTNDDAMYQEAIFAFGDIGATESIEAVLEVCDTCTE